MTVGDWSSRTNLLFSNYVVFMITHLYSVFLSIQQFFEIVCVYMFMLVRYKYQIGRTPSDEATSTICKVLSERPGRTEVIISLKIQFFENPIF